MRGQNMIYLVGKDDICISLTLEAITDMPSSKPATITVYDYYEPSIATSEPYSVMCRYDLRLKF